jgi:hypothetical protein
MGDLKLIDKQLMTPPEPQMPVFTPEAALAQHIQKLNLIQPPPQLKMSDHIK